MMLMNKEKIGPQHLGRGARVYVRQSTLDQVRHNHESRRRQYELEGRARSLGWTEVEVIDEDLGKSAAGSTERTGFQRLVAAVGLGQVGAVFSIEVSRLARNNRDWYQLLDLCGLMDTLIVDGEAIYDTRQLNDRLLLGLKGTISEAELGWIRQRAQEGLLAKARRGELILSLVVGYVESSDGGVEKHPDQRVQQAIALVFRKFSELRSVRQVLIWLRHERILLPVAVDAKAGTISWRLPVYNTVLKVLQNPYYAGAYAFGRTTGRIRVVDGKARKTAGHRRDQRDWIALRRDHHEGYIAWETYENNQRVIAENAQMKGLMSRGAVKRGPSLLAGLLLCGKCGRKIHVAYSGSRGQVPRYYCRGALINHGECGCISFGGHRVDEAIEREVLRVLSPGAIEAAVQSADQVVEDTDEICRAVELEMSQACYERDRAQRQYDAVEPENRLVAETLEKRWNLALERVHQLEHRLEEIKSKQKKQAAPDRAELLALAKSFPALWSHPATDHLTKKRLVRLIIYQIVARLVEDNVELVIHWQGGKHTILSVRKNRTGQHRHSTSREVVDVVRDLARCLPDGQIARVLNRLGYRTGADNSWTQSRVVSLRSHHKISVFDPQIDGVTSMTLGKAAEALGVSNMTVRRMIQRGILPAKQPVTHAPWSIAPEALTSEPVKRAVHAVKQGRDLPLTASDDQLALIKSST
jgi:DNA invertase Pin-like site-specific DNA recombinase